METWQATGGMTAKVRHFDLRVGGGYEMLLFYPDSETEMKGKTKGKEDRFTPRFIDLIPNKKLVQAVNFESSDPEFSGEMIMEVTFETIEKGTNVTFYFKDIPKGNQRDKHCIFSICRKQPPKYRYYTSLNWFSVYKFE